MRLIYFDMQHNHVHMQHHIIITCNMHVDLFMSDVTIIIKHYDIVIYNAHDNIIMLHNGGILLSSKNFVNTQQNYVDLQIIMKT